MILKTFSRLLVCTLLCSSFIACTSGGSGNDDPEVDCTAFNQLHTNPFTPVTLGDPIQLSADHLDGVQYYWVGPNSFDVHAEDPQVTFSAEYKHRGWYYLNMEHDGCTNRVDSIYVKVKFPQGSPSCTLVNNRTTFGGPVTLPTQNYYFMTWGADVTSNTYEVVANGTNGDMSIYLSPYWITHDFEDGIYRTTNNPSPEYGDYDKIFISDVNSSTYWVAQANQQVYLSHVGGKIRISFCNLVLNGVTGPAGGYTTSASGQLTQP